MNDKTDPNVQAIERAKVDAEMARKRLSSTMAAMQNRLRPANLANDAWTGVKEKSGALADDAIQAVKDRPVTASGVFAALVIFLARDPLWAVASGFLRGKQDEDLITAKLTEPDQDYDIAAPAVTRPQKEGVNA